MRKKKAVTLKGWLMEGVQHFKAYAQTLWFKVFIVVIVLGLGVSKQFSLEFKLNAVNTPFSETDLFNPEVSKNLLNGNDWTYIIKEANGGLRFFFDSESNFEHIPAKIVKDKVIAVHNYIKKYKEVALLVGKKHNIPVSILLANALMESNAGQSVLAKRYSNHFKIKCDLRCFNCQCIQLQRRGSSKLYRLFEKPVDSFEAYCQLIIETVGKDMTFQSYRSWAKELDAIDHNLLSKRSQKLITLIDVFHLHQFDD